MSGCEATPEVKAIVRAMAKNRVDAGITDASDLVDSIWDEIHEHTPLWKSEIADIISGYGQVRKQTKVEIKTRLEQLRAELRADAKRVDADSIKANALRRQIAELERKIDARDTSKPAKSQPQDTPQLRELRAQLKDARERLARLQPAPPPTKPADPNEAANSRRQAALKKSIAELEHKLATGDFSPPAKREPVYDEKSLALEAERAALAKKADRYLDSLARRNRTPGGKLADFLLELRRAVILSSVHTLGKLTAAASVRGVSEPIENVAGSLLHLIPGVRAISNAAPVQGGLMSPAAELAALRATFSRETVREAARTALTGTSHLDSLYSGKDHIRHYPYLEWVGQLHGALKTPAKRNVFFRTVTKLDGYYRRGLVASGMSPAEVDAKMASPQMQAVITAKAYAEGQRAILMSDNFLSSWWKSGIGAMKNVGKPHSAERAIATGISRLGEYLLPIVKIPTNAVFETTSYVAGGPKALLQLAVTKAGEKLTPEQADYVMLNLKKQSVGVALMSLGFLAQASIGGYYERNKRKGPDDPEYGGMKLFGVNIPRWLVHSPVLETLQIGATLAHVYQDAGKKGGDIAGAAWEAFKGLMGEIPFIDQVERVGRGLDHPAAYAGENVRDAFIPPDLQRYAKSIDPVQGQSRKAEGFIDAVKLGIPGEREDVPVRGMDGLTLDSRLAIFEHATEKERKDYGLREKILGSHWEEGVDALPKSLQKEALARIERVRQSPPATHGLEFASNDDGSAREITPKEYPPAEEQFRAHRAKAVIGKIEKSLRGAFASNGLGFVEKELEKHRDELGPDVWAEVETDDHGNDKLVLHGLKARRDALSGKGDSAP